MQRYGHESSKTAAIQKEPELGITKQSLRRKVPV